MGGSDLSLPRGTPKSGGKTEGDVALECFPSHLSSKPFCSPDPPNLSVEVRGQGWGRGPTRPSPSERGGGPGAPAREEGAVLGAGSPARAGPRPALGHSQRRPSRRPRPRPRSPGARADNYCAGGRAPARRYRSGLGAAPPLPRRVRRSILSRPGRSGGATPSPRRPAQGKGGLAPAESGQIPITRSAPPRDLGGALPCSPSARQGPRTVEANRHRKILWGGGGP